MENFWSACLGRFEKELSAQQFNTWIKPLIATVADDFSKAVILVGNRFKLDWIRAQYAGRLAAMLESLQGHPLKLEHPFL